MSETGPDPAPREPRWVKSNVIGGEPAEAPAPAALTEEAQGPVPVPDQPPVTTEELAGARWFAIAFLVVVIPLGLILFGLIVWGFIRLVAT